MSKRSVSSQSGPPVTSSASTLYAAAAIFLKVVLRN